MNPMNMFHAEAQAMPVYRESAVMTFEVAKAMSTALTNGDAVVCIASGSQRRQLKERMQVLGIDVVGALMREQLVCLNALDTLMKVIVNDVPDAVRFAEVIGAVVDRAAARYPRVMTFSDLASVSLKKGNMSGALELETLLTSFLASRPVLSRCASRAVSFNPGATDTLEPRSVKRLQFRETAGIGGAV